MSRKTVALFSLALSLALIATVWGLRIHAELAAGRSVFWLAELWTPAAVVTLILVVCVDYAMGRPKDSQSPEATGHTRPVKRRLRRRN